MNGRQKKKKFRKFILAYEGYRKSRERVRRENAEWRKESRKLRISLWDGQKYSWPNRYRNKTTCIICERDGGTVAILRFGG